MKNENRKQLNYAFELKEGPSADKRIFRVKVK